MRTCTDYVGLSEGRFGAGASEGCNASLTSGGRD